jgi:long-chain acyl-CoA synthetase
MLYELFEKFQQIARDKTAIICGNELRTYGQLVDSIRQDAAALVRLGIGYGDRVAFFMGNQPELIELYCACFLIGAVAVPLNSRFQTAEVVYACEKCTPRLLIVGADLFPRADGVVSNVSSLDKLFVIDSEAPDDAKSWSRVMETSDPVGLPTLPDDPDHPALIMFTSGSTSKPKGVTHTHKSILSTVSSRQQAQELGQEDISLVATGICHVAGSLGMSFPTLYAGGTVVIMEDFDPAAYCDAVITYRPTRAFLLPSELLEVVEHPRAQSTDFGSLREVECGGNLVTHDLYEHFRKVTGYDLMQMFGLTECEGVCLNPPSGLNKVGSMGKPRVGVEIRLEDHTSDEVPVGKVGEILVRSDSMTIGYWDDLENTKKAIVDGWLRTGDLARQDEDGYYYFVGRIKEIIVKGGSNVAPGEVEEVIDDHPDVVACAVVGKPDPHYGELIHAFVELEPGAISLPTAERLASYASERLAAYKVPDGWTFLERLPRNPVGKIDRNRLHVLAADLKS